MTDDPNRPLIDETAEQPAGSTYEDAHSAFQSDYGMPMCIWLERLKRHGINNLLSEFKFICECDAELRCSLTTSACMRYAHLNRYRSVLLYDATRVVLKDGLGHDYIHASRVDGYKHKSAYVVCQGPLSTTVVDFWRMVWQEQSVLIVMLTAIIEDDSKKCAIYFPTSSAEDLVCGPFRLSLKEFQRRSCGDIALLNVTCILSNERRDVMLMIHQDWPDQRIPLKPKLFIDFFFLTKKAQATMMKRVHPNWSGHPMGAPIVFHCSAGIGQSACFVAIDVSVQLMMNAQRANISAIVRQLRTQRRHAICIPLHFLFIHWIVLRIAMSLGLVGVAD